jgi:ubiquinone biosynthesis protein COQ9
MNNAPLDPVKTQLLAAILPHVAFEGWSQTAFAAAVAEVGLNPDHARTLCPRGATDLAIAFHQDGDRAMRIAVKAADLRQMRYSEKVAFAVRARIAAISDKEAVRRGTALFALPHMAADGARLIWGTADAIWDVLGDTSDDFNWYSKRATLSAVWTSTVMFWLGDDSLGGQATDAFIDRRIANVMQIEKLKAQVNASPLLKPLTSPLLALLNKIKAPTRIPPVDLPGSWTAPRG